MMMMCLMYYQHKQSPVLAVENQLKLSQGPLPMRCHQILALQEKEFDVLVIGGGATGSGVALDAVSRGQTPRISYKRVCVCVCLSIYTAHLNISLDMAS